MPDFNLVDFVDKRVTLTTAEGEQVGTIKAANDAVIMFVPKGTSSPELIEVPSIVNVEAVAEKPRKLSQKAMEPVDSKKVRRHLLDYHGYQLADVNELSDVDAEKVHNGIDHSVLGHHHEGRNQSDANEANGEAASE